MRCYNPIDFVAMVSQTSISAYMIVSIDPAIFDDADPSSTAGEDLCRDALYGLLDEDTIDSLIHDCSTTIVFADLVEAGETFRRFQVMIPQMANIGLEVVVLSLGVQMLCASQPTEKARPRHLAVQSLALM